MSDTKLCAECKWFGGIRWMDSILSRDPSRDVCTHVFTQIIDLVRGESSSPLCLDIRSASDRHCGVSGNLFEQFLVSR